MPFSKLLVATDLSQEAKTAVDMAVALASRGATDLTILHVVDLGELFPSYPVFLPPERRQAIQDEVHERVSATLRDLQRDLIPPGIPCDTDAQESTNVAQTICDYARERDFDLIVLGTHGRSGFSHALLGSVAERVLHLSCVPLMIVPVRR